MRNFRSVTSVAAAFLGLLAAIPGPAPAGSPVAATSQPTSEADLERALADAPNDLTPRLAWIDAALARQQYALALDRVHTAEHQCGQSPAMQYRAAAALFGLDRILAAAEVRTVPGGRAGQFANDWLLVEARPGVERFLCCPRDSALYQLRAALDGGFDEPAAHLLHARIWLRLDRPQLGWAVLQSRAALLLADPTDETLQVFADLALAAGELRDYLRFERRRAADRPAEEAAIMAAAYVTVAEKYAQRGDEGLYLHWLHRAARVRPDDTALLLRLADAEWSAGHVARAAERYRQALRLDPHGPQRDHILARLAECAAAAEDR